MDTLAAMADVRTCASCGSQINAHSRMCVFCGAQQPDAQPPDMDQAGVQQPGVEQLGVQERDVEAARRGDGDAADDALAPPVWHGAGTPPPRDDNPDAPPRMTWLNTNAMAERVAGRVGSRPRGLLILGATIAVVAVIALVVAVGGRHPGRTDTFPSGGPGLGLGLGDATSSTSSAAGATNGATGAAPAGAGGGSQGAAATIGLRPLYYQYRNADLTAFVPQGWSETGVASSGSGTSGGGGAGGARGGAGPPRPRPTASRWPTRPTRVSERRSPSRGPPQAGRCAITHNRSPGAPAHPPPCRSWWHCPAARRPTA